MCIPRPEHPKPQFQRDSWHNLNGTWQFEIDQGDTGEERGLAKTNAVYTKSITVPFCPESSLSGVASKDFMMAVWYRRTILVTNEQLAGRIVLHFGAVDYECTVFVNGKQAGEHKGGYVSFSFDITPFLSEGENTLTVRARDDTRSLLIPSGKQSERYDSYSCLYTRSTGIWQTVWLEYTPVHYVRSFKFYPQPQDGYVTVELNLVGCDRVTVTAFYQKKKMGSIEKENTSGRIVLQLPLEEIHWWEPGHGRLYEVEITFGSDRVHSYFGLRTVAFDGYRFMLNERSVFQRLILDQGYYPDGIYTAPSDRALEQDIQLAMQMGFNGARLHQKVFEERFLYHCDRLGYMVWGEYPSWGVNDGDPALLHPVLSEWLEELERDFNHPSIIGWCPFNETHPGQYRPTLSVTYRATKAIDPTRPCIDASGYIHVETDVFDLHDYDQNPETFRARYASLAATGVLQQPDYTQNSQTHRGEPVFISEYGGIRWSHDQSGWGYGEGPKTPEEFIARFRGLAEAQLENPCLFGLCYTQLTDVEQEQNGLYTFDRQPKFPPETIRKIMQQKAAIEK